MEKIRAGEDPEVDPFEAMKVVEQLSLTEVDDVIPDGDSFNSSSLSGSWARQPSTC